MYVVLEPEEAELESFCVQDWRDMRRTLYVAHYSVILLTEPHQDAQKVVH